MSKVDVNFSVGWQVPISDPKSLDLYEIDIYFEMQKQAIERFGEDTLLLYQMGKFYEVYGREENEDDEKRIEAFSECCNLADGAHKSTGIPKHRFISPPRMLGVPIQSIEKYRNLLLSAGWTLVIVSEKKMDSDVTRPLREITEIVSGATHEDLSGNSYVISSVYVEPIKSSSSGTIRYYSFGYASISTTTGKASVVELTETKSNVQDFLQRQLLIHNPDEVFLCTECAKDIFDWTLYKTRQLEVEAENMKINHIHATILAKIVGFEKSSLTYKDRQLIRSQIGISHIHEQGGFVAFAEIVRYILQQKQEIISKIRCVTEDGACILYGNAIDQLSIFSKKTMTASSQLVPSQKRLREEKWDSLYSLMDVCGTKFGSRYLHFRLSHPSTNTSEIRRWHNAIGLFHKERMFEKVRGMCMGSLDMERIIRRIEINLKMTPNLVLCLWRVLDTWKAIHAVLMNSKEHLKLNMGFDMKWEEIESVLSKWFDRDALMENKGDRWQIPINPESVYKKKVVTVKDVWKRRINYIRGIINVSSDSNSIKVCSGDKMGYTVTIPKSKVKLFRTWKGEKNTNMDPLIEELREVELKAQQGGGKLSHPAWVQEYVDWVSLCGEIHRENVEYLQLWQQDFWQTYGNDCIRMIEWAATIDVQSTFAYISAKYGYHKPTIIPRSSSIIMEGKDMRHPMIERIQETVSGYVANDVYLTQSSHGLLLYGMNASGKSSYMKSIGLCAIMSQAGCWVPCSKCRHVIFKKIFTRISGNDDYMRGKSSFALEMEEMRTILREGDSESIVLGDELCRGTEHISGTAIVGGGIHTLLKKKVPFVFATHLHDIPKLSVLKTHIEAKVLQVKHLRVIHNAKTNELIYERKLTDGQGSSMYGIEVAEALGVDRETIKDAYVIREELLGFEEKTSRYSGNKLIKTCEVCGEHPATETHHIREQHTADEYKIVDGKTRMNAVSNLVGICEECHLKHHRGEIEIVGWTETSKGNLLIVNKVEVQ